MAEIASVLQTTQIGIEGTAGTDAPANKLLNATSIMFEPQGDVTVVQVQGQKYANQAALNREWTQWSWEQPQASYTELIYPLAAMYAAASATGGTAASATAYVWTFTTANAGADANKSFTIQQGDSNRAHGACYNVGQDWEITFSRQEVTAKGVLFGGKFNDGTTLTSTPTAITIAPVLGGQVDVYFDPGSSGTIGTTKLTRDFVATFRVNGKYGPVWPLNTSNPSWVAPVDLQPTAELELQVEANSDGMALITYLRQTDTALIRLQAAGETIAGTSSYRMRIDGAFQVSEMPSMGDLDGVYTATFKFVNVYDATLGKAHSIEIVNDLAAL